MCSSKPARTRLVGGVLALLLACVVTAHGQFGVLGRGVGHGGPPTQAGAVTDSDLFFSPWNWSSDGAGALQSNNIKASSTYAESNTPGAYFVTVFSGTSVKINVSVTMLSGASVTALDYPALDYSVDAAAPTRTQLTSASTQLTLGTGLADTTHTLAVNFLGVGLSADRWTTPVMALRVTGLVLDASRYLSVPSIRPKRLLGFGDSNTEVEEGLGSGVSVAHQVASLSYLRLLGAACLNAEVGVVGFSFTGYSAVGNAGTNLPNLQDGWSLYAAGKSRLVAGALSPAPDYLLSDMGINDNTGGFNVVAPVTALIGAWRTAAPSAKILLVVPWNGDKAAQIQTGTTNAADGNAYFLNTGVTSYASTGPHLLVAGHAAYQTDLCALIP